MTTTPQQLLAALTHLNTHTHPGYHHELTRTPDGTITGADIGVLAHDRERTPTFLSTHHPITEPPPTPEHLTHLHAAATHRANHARLHTPPPGAP